MDKELQKSIEDVVGEKFERAMNQAFLKGFVIPLVSYALGLLTGIYIMWVINS